MGFWEITWQNMTYQQGCKSKFVQEMEHLREFLQPIIMSYLTSLRREY